MVKNGVGGKLKLELYDYTVYSSRARILFWILILHSHNFYNQFTPQYYIPVNNEFLISKYRCALKFFRISKCCLNKLLVYQK